MPLIVKSSVIAQWFALSWTSPACQVPMGSSGDCRLASGLLMEFGRLCHECTTGFVQASMTARQATADSIMEYVGTFGR